MRIEFMPNETTPFSSIKVGQTFQQGKTLYLKIAPKSGTDSLEAEMSPNAVDLKSGLTVFVEDSALVNDKGKFCITEI